MLSIAGGVILGGLGLLLVLALLPWIAAVVQAVLYALVAIPVGICRLIGRGVKFAFDGLIFCICHPLKAARLGWEGSILRWWIREVF